jgi:hypothetical protein
VQATTLLRFRRRAASQSGSSLSRNSSYVGERPAHGGHVGDVDRDCVAVDVGRNLLRANLVAIGHHDPRTLGGQPAGDGRTDAGRSPGDERDPPGEARWRAWLHGLMIGGAHRRRQ